MTTADMGTLADWVESLRSRMVGAAAAALQGRGEYLLATDASLQSPDAGMDEGYWTRLQQTGVQLQTESAAQRFAAMEIAERDSIEEGMQGRDGAVVWLWVGPGHYFQKSESK